MDPMDLVLELKNNASKLLLAVTGVVVRARMRKGFCAT
jgi:hypothetical protein